MKCFLAVCLLLAIGVSAAAAAGPAYTFTQDGPRYTFACEFTVAAQPDRVLELLYRFEHLQRFSQPISETELLAEGPGWQTVRFTYSTWLGSLVTTFRRELDQPGRTIRFRMTEALRTGLPLPMPAATSGEYRLEPTEGGVRVVYRQEGEVNDSLLVRAWMSRARSEAIRFAAGLESYVRAQAKNPQGN
jgi:hypothetical protein